MKAIPRRVRLVEGRRPMPPPPPSPGAAQDAVRAATPDRPRTREPRGLPRRRVERGRVERPGHETHPERHRTPGDRLAPEDLGPPGSPPPAGADRGPGDPHSHAGPPARLARGPD